jgi:PhnB protein
VTTIAPWLSVTDATAAVAFYQEAFGATPGEVADSGGGVIEVAELFIGDAAFWVQRDGDLPPDAAPGQLVRMIVTVPDPDAAFARAIATGASELAAMHEEHGWRTGRLADPFGHQWEFARRTGSADLS